MVRGISLLDLLAPVPGVSGILPDAIARQLERLAVVEHHAADTPSSFVHRGVVRPLVGTAMDALGLPAIGDWPIEAPGITTGLPFTLTRLRVAREAGDTIEPAAAVATLDLHLERVSILVPGLVPALRVGEASGDATATHLAPDPSGGSVRIVGTAVLRIDLRGDGAVARLVHAPDPFDALASTGLVVRATFEPPHFMIGSTGYGLTVDRLLYDASEDISPAEVLARGQDASFVGLAIAEATLYLPQDAPLVGDLSVGVKDLLLGRPFGMQGELHVEFGRTPIDPAVLGFVQTIDGTNHPLAPTLDGRTGVVPLVTDAGPDGVVSATLDPATAALPSRPEFTFTLPDESTQSGSSVGPFAVRAGQTLRATPIETDVDTGTVVHGEELTWTFREDTGDPQHAPQVRWDRPDGSVNNGVVHIAGTASDVAGIVLGVTTPAADATYRWTLGSGVDADVRTGTSFTLAAGLSVGRHDVKLTDPAGHVRRVRVEVLAAGKLFVGCTEGVVDANGVVQRPRAVLSSHDLSAFHEAGATLRPGPAVTLDASQRGVVTPPGALATVALEVGAVEDPDIVPPPVPETLEIRRLQVWFSYNETRVSRWGPGLRPAGVAVDALDNATAAREVARWSAGFSGAQFVVVGRCCDIGRDGPQADLARRRAAAAAGWLTGTVHGRGEQDPTGGAPATPVAGDNATGRLIFAEQGTPPLPWSAEADDARRLPYRRVDIHAIGGTVTAPGPAGDAVTVPNTEAGHEATLRRIMVPGADLDTPATPVPREPRLPFLVRLVVGWDSPTAQGPADAIPTTAEITIEWASRNVTHPALGAGGVTPRSPGSTSTTEVFTLVGRWTHDARVGTTTFGLALSSSGDPDGLAAVESDILAAGLALAPALLAGIGDVSESGVVRSVALLAAAGVLAAFGKDGRVVLHGVEIEHRQAALGELARSRTRILVDYTAELGFSVAAAGIGSISTDDGKPLKVRHTGVGIEYDDAETDPLDKIGVVFTDATFAVADPGRWRIAGPMGELLRVVGTRSGVGSTWFEVDLAFALDLGVVTVTNATIRVTFGDGGPSIELRGLGAKVSIPGTLEGSGRVSLAGQEIRAGLEVSIIPMDVKGAGSLAFDPAKGFFAISASLVLPVGIPLGTSGLGLFGFSGRFVSNGRRQLPANDDPVQREIDWYRAPDETKFTAEPGQWALGLGAIVGTLPDGGFTFNANGSFVVGFPDPLVVFGIDAKLLTKPEATPTERGAPPAGGLSILGLVAIDPSAVAIAVRAEYELPKVLELKMPLSGYFPLSGNPASWYLRIGSDGHNGRHGDPVTLTFLPGILDLRSWAYLMVEERELHALGGDDRFSFDGFSIGFGTGAEIRWSAGPIKLEASIKLLVGLGTDPFLLKGGLFIRGELSLVVISISVTGEIILTLWEDAGDLKANLQGKFCGKVSFFFFSIKGCVGIEIGDSLTPTAPPPPSPVGSVVTTDRRGFTTGDLTAGGPSPTVWPDAVPVIGFTHNVGVALDAPTSAFLPGPAAAGPRWSGTTEMKYAFRITAVSLVPRSGPALHTPGDPVLDSAWWLPTHRPGVLSDGDVAPSESEGRHLALMSWDPAPWSRALGDRGDTIPGDPAVSVGRLCDPPLVPARTCVRGGDGSRVDLDRIDLPHRGASTPPVTSRFTARLAERAFGKSLSTWLPVITTSGMELVPGRAFTTGVARWELSQLHREGARLLTFGADVRLVGAIREPEIVLFACHDRRDSSPTRGLPDPNASGWECLDLRDVKDNEARPGFTRGRFSLKPAAGELRRVAQRITFPDAGVQILLDPPAAVVRIGVFTFSPAKITLQAFSAAGDIVDEAVIVDAAEGVRHEIELKASDGARIARVEVRGGASEAAISDVCVRDQQPAHDDDDHDRVGIVGRFPLVTSVAPNGRRVAWEPTVEQSIQTSGGTCMRVRYRPPDEITGDVAELRVHPWARGPVGVVEICGVTASAGTLLDDDGAHRDHLTDEITRRADEELAFREHLLRPGTVYDLSVTWEWQGWVRSDDTPEPTTPPADGDWQTGGTEVRTFATAASVPPDLDEPVDFVDESRFDPRGLQRYLLGFDPDGPDAAPHLLDSPLLVHLAIDHAEALCDRYALDLVLEVRRTDPPPGATASGPLLPLTVLLGHRPLMDGMRPPAERRIVEKLRDLPCLDEPAVGGTTITVDAPLEPQAEYDLVLLTRPQGAAADDRSDDVVIDRAHFRTSRHRDAAELVGSLGFSTTDANPILAGDAIVETDLPAPAPAPERDDGAFAQRLSALGMDPWPLAPHGRTTVLWRRDGSRWVLVGLLLEADEPLLRPSPREVRIARVQIGPLILKPLVANAAGTRVILAPPAATELAAETTMEIRIRTVDLEPDGSDVTAQVVARRRTLAIPRSVQQEVGA